jgi:hypothetical protein
VLDDRLARHAQAITQLAQALPAARVETIEQLPARAVSSTRSAIPSAHTKAHDPAADNTHPH